MKNITLTTLTIFCLLLLSQGARAASDCSGPWQVLQNRQGQSPCKALGLDSNRGVCRPGDVYETLCDDMTGGKYRICQGPQRCGSAQSGNRNDCTYWDNDYNRPCQAGTRNYDCRGGCDAQDERKYKKDRNYRNDQNDNACRNWDYNYDQPCPRGYINYDCRGGCEPR